jgi:excinuclease ABC subunit A
MPSDIVLRGVRVHNLKGIDVTIPTRRLVVVTGVSGSGKSSLAFDTLYAEGQRRYVESLSSYARQFLERMEKPRVDEVSGICPAIAIRQRTLSRSPRSTVATATEIHDHLRLLFARAGRTVCDGCGEEVRRDSAASVAERLLAEPEGTRVLVAFEPPEPLRAESLAALRKRGFTRLLVEQVDRGRPEAPSPGARVLVDRVVARDRERGRLVDSLEAALREGGGRAEALVPGRAPLRVSERFECGRCRRDFAEPQPRLFSFNNPFGACPSCHGFGNLIEVDLDLVVPDKHRSLSEGAVEPWNRPHYRSVLADLRRFAHRRGIPLDVPWSFLDEGHRRLVLEGDEEFPGILGFFRWLEGRKYRVQVRAFLARYRGYQECPGCGGGRLRPEALRVRLGGLSIRDVAALSVGAARRFLRGLSFSPQEEAIAGRVRHEADRRLSFLEDVGLDYLNLDRASATLSGGESQRIALAAALGTGLVGTLFVLDEPSVGLHPRDTERLIGILKALRDQGDTVVVVEHDPAIVTAADHVIDLGPGAGEQGGRVVYQGPAEALGDEARSLTAKYLRGDLRIPVPARRRRGSGLFLNVRGASLHNLKRIDARFPLGAFTVVTGVSGSGKSTLVHDVLCARLGRRRGAAEGCGGPVVEGAEYVEQLEVVDQSPLGRSPRSNPVTYMKAFDAIRELFAASPEARRRGLGAAAFSFNMPGGRCEACGGDGRVRVDLQFLADAWLVCEACGGRRYRAPVLQVRWRGRSVDQVLDLTVNEALHVFAGQHRVTRRLKVLAQIGLGYLRLGQPASTLSGGEAQRVKLAAHLLRRPGPRVLYVLDEPTTGLHMGDVDELLNALQRLLDGGATVIVIEHNLHVIKQADWVIDLGPEGGEAGGRVVFQGRRRWADCTAHGAYLVGAAGSRPTARAPSGLVSSGLMAESLAWDRRRPRRQAYSPAWVLAPRSWPRIRSKTSANLKSPTARTRQAAAAALGKSRRREAVPPLSALVRDPEPASGAPRGREGPARPAGPRRGPRPRDLAAGRRSRDPGGGAGDDRRGVRGA